MYAVEARDVVAWRTGEVTAPWGVRVLLAAAVARAPRPGVNRETIRTVFEELLRPETDDEGDADV